jgi:hypothetical protein
MDMRFGRLPSGSEKKQGRSGFGSLAKLGAQPTVRPAGAVVFGDVFRRRLASMGITEVVSAPASPWQNPFVERRGTVAADLVGVMQTRPNPLTAAARAVRNQNPFDTVRLF